MVDDLNLNGNSLGTELAAPERREGERSEPSRSGGAASLTGSAAPAPADPEVVAKAKRRRFTAAYKLAVVEEAERATEPGEIGALLRREGLYSSHLVEWRRLPRGRRAQRLVEEARPQTEPQSPGRGEPPPSGRECPADA